MFDRLVLYDFATDPTPASFRQELKQYADELVVIEAEDDYEGSLTPAELEGTDALITRPFEDFADWSFPSSLEYIGTATTDASHFDIETCRSQGITVTNVPQYAKESVAELTVTMLLHILNQVGDATRDVQAGNYDLWKFKRQELAARTVGIIGLGSIGRRVAELCTAFGADVQYYDIERKEDAEREGYDFKELDALLQSSDIISIHCDLNERSKHLLDADRIDRIPDNAILLNPSRSGVTDLQAVIERCQDGTLTAWYEAVYEEGLREKLANLKHGYVTPHYGCNTVEAQQRLREILIENIEAYRSGTPQNVVTL